MEKKDKDALMYLTLSREIISNIGHEVNNKLFILMSLQDYFVEKLGAQDPKLKKYEEQIDSIQKLIQSSNLLFNTGHMGNAADLTQIKASIEDFYRKKTGNTGLKFSFDFEKGTEHIECHPGALQSVVFILLAFVLRNPPKTGENRFELKVTTENGRPIFRFKADGFSALKGTTYEGIAQAFMDDLKDTIGFEISVY